MFTGIIVGTGKVTKLDQKTKNRSAIQMTVNLGKYAKGLRIGQSVAINGVCLSATKISKNNCVFEMIDETTKKTDLGNVKTGSTVNIERSLKVGDRLEGHFVLGHIDGVATITKIELTITPWKMKKNNSLIFNPFNLLPRAVPKKIKAIFITTSGKREFTISKV